MSSRKAGSDAKRASGKEAPSPSDAKRAKKQPDDDATKEVVVEFKFRSSKT